LPRRDWRRSVQPVDIGDGPWAVKGGGAVGVGRIEEEECGRPVIACNAAFPVEVFDGDAVEADIELSDGIHASGAGSGCSGA